MKLRFVFFLAFLLSQVQAQSTKNALAEGVFATISTSKGTIELELNYQKAPVTVANFITLSEGKNTFVKDEKLKGKPFFNGLKFHRVINDFMIQGGDPTGTGSGSPGYSFKDEFTDLVFDKGGILAMANSGPKTNGSQFFITHKETPWLNGKHTIFGKVTAGMEVVNKIAQDDVINTITIVRRGSLAKKFNAEKIITEYFAQKAQDDIKEAQLLEENNKKVAIFAAQKKLSLEKLKETATTNPSGLVYAITQKGTGEKPVAGTTIYFHYSGFFENGTLFDSSVEEVSKQFGKFNPARAAQNGYLPMPFEIGNKTKMIPGFIEGLEQMAIGDKATIYIPPTLAYGAAGAGGVIPPNATLIFELEMFDKQ